jgi:adenylate cyclase
MIATNLPTENAPSSNYVRKVKVFGHLFHKALSRNDLADINHLHLHVKIDDSDASLQITEVNSSGNSYWIYPLSINDAANLLDLCDPRMIRTEETHIPKSILGGKVSIIDEEIPYSRALLSISTTGKGITDVNSSSEIERKFLVSNSFDSRDYKSVAISQGYISSRPECTIRIRTFGEKAFLTIKGIGNASGVSRFEFEIEIPRIDADELFGFCEPGIIDKVRFMVPCGEHIIEVDYFSGENTGLVVAEIELKSEDEAFERPAWLGVEVTGQVKYYNSYLSHTPFSRW